MYIFVCLFVLYDCVPTIILIFKSVTLWSVAYRHCIDILNAIKMCLWIKFSHLRLMLWSICIWLPRAQRLAWICFFSRILLEMRKRLTCHGYIFLFIEVWNIISISEPYFFQSRTGLFKIWMNLVRQIIRDKYTCTPRTRGLLSQPPAALCSSEEHFY